MSATRMAANPVPVRPEVIEKANAAPELGRTLFTYEHDSDYETLSSDKRLFIAETWGVEESKVTEFGELRRNPETRAAFIAEWDEEPELDYFENFVHQHWHNWNRQFETTDDVDGDFSILLDGDGDAERGADESRAFIAHLSAKYGADLLAELFGRVSLEGQALVQSQIQARRPVTVATVKS